MKKLTQDDYRHYKRQSYWTYKECISIMIGVHSDSIIDTFDRENSLHQNLAIQMKELSETMDRSIDENDLITREDLLDLLVIGADDPTFVPEHFLEWARNKDYQIPLELGFFNAEEVDSKIPDKEKINVKNRLREFQFEYVNNNEIKITIGKNKTSTKSAGDLEFDLEKGKKAWNVFIEILENPPHEHDCGASQTTKGKTEYQKEYGYLRQISKKLVKNFFNKELELNLPGSYKLFESVKGGTGVFKFIFKVKDRSTLSSCTSKNDFTYKFTRAYKEAKKHPDDKNKQQFVIDLVQDARKNGYLTEIEAESYWIKAKESAKRITQITHYELENGHNPQPGIQSQDPDIAYTDNIDDYS